MKLYLLLLLTLLTVSLESRASKKNKEMTLTPLEELDLKEPKIRRRLAHAIIYLDVDGLAPSIKVQKLGTSLDDLDELPFDESLSKKILRVSWTLPLKNIKKGFYFMAVEPGVYQITHVNAPYFNLPFKVSTDDDPRWRFRVYPHAFNYIGHLKINKERSTDAVETYFLDRFYSDKEEINAMINGFSQSINLTHAVQTHTHLALGDDGENL